MSASPRDIFQLIGYIEGDMRGINAKLTTLRSMIASLNLPDPKRVECPKCGALHVQGSRALALHMQNVHGGPAVPMDKREAAA